MDTLLVGHARECITPTEAVHMMGYSARTGLSEGVHDDLMANAVALSDHNTTMLVLALDIASLDLDKVAELKRALTRGADIEPDDILVNTSHTHAGPMVAERPGATFEVDCFDTMVERCVEAGIAALADLRPATLSIGSARLDIGCNRRKRTAEGKIILGVNRAGPRLAEVTVWRLARASAADVVLFSTPIHGTTLGHENLLISAEWMGAAVRKLEGADMGIRAVFLQGCAGNQNPYRDERSFERIAQHGEATSVAVRNALEATQGIAALPLVNLVGDMLLPLDEGGTSSCPIHGLRLGDALLIGLGGEAFVEYDLYARDRSEAQSTLVLGYTDASVGYLPTEVAYAEGGYEPNANVHFPLGKSWHPRIEQALKWEIDTMLLRLLEV